MPESSSASTLGFGHFLEQSDTVGVLVLAILILMSMASWYQIIVKTWLQWRLRVAGRRFLDALLARARLSGSGRHACADLPERAFRPDIGRRRGSLSIAQVLRRPARLRDELARRFRQCHIGKKRRQRRIRAGKRLVRAGLGRLDRAFRRSLRHGMGHLPRLALHRFFRAGRPRPRSRARSAKR